MAVPGARAGMAGAVVAIPRLVVGVMVLAAIGIMLWGVFARYVLLPFTDWLDWDTVNFFWVEEMGETTLAWLTLIGAAVGVATRSHFTLNVFAHHLPRGAQRAIHVLNHLLIAAFGGIVAWLGFKLALLNAMLTSPALEFSLAWLYAAAPVGGVLMVLYGLAGALDPSGPDHDITDVRE